MTRGGSERPGDPLDDVAYACEYVAPFRDDATCLRWHGFSAPPTGGRSSWLPVDICRSCRTVSSGR